MDNWRRVWRLALSKILPVAGMRQLMGALESNDPRLIQEATCSPPPLQCVMNWPVEKADPIVFCYWQNTGQELTTVGECEEAFAKCCYEADKMLGEPAEVRWFLNAWDDGDREVMRWELLAEVIRSLQEMDNAQREV